MQAGFFKQAALLYVKT